MTPYEQLLAEAIPIRPPAKPPHEPWTPEEQDQHWTQLCRSVGTPHAARPPRPDTDQAAA